MIARFGGRILCLAVLAGIATDVLAQDRTEPDVMLYVPAFESQGLLGFRVATVLNLQIWQTLRRAPFPNPDNLSFGRGLVTWDATPLAVGTHEEAERAGRAVGADLVLWGKAWSYGDGVVVQAYVTVVDSPGTQAVARWRADITTGDGPESVAVALPRLRYEFAPIVLDAEVVQSLESPAGLQIVAEKGSTEVLGRVGPEFLALRHDGDWTRVEADSVRGWVHLPQLSDDRSEVVDFVAGLIRVLRTDWMGAEQMLGRVAANASAPNGIKIDAQLLQALAAHHRGGDALAPILRAYAMNPHEVVVTRFECMEYVARLERATNLTVRQRTRDRLAEILNQRGYLYVADDPWFAKVRRLVESTEPAGGRD